MAAVEVSWVRAVRIVVKLGFQSVLGACFGRVLFVAVRIVVIFEHQLGVMIALLLMMRVVS